MALAILYCMKSKKFSRTEALILSSLRVVAKGRQNLDDGTQYRNGLDNTVTDSGIMMDILFQFISKLDNCNSTERFYLQNWARIQLHQSWENGEMFTDFNKFWEFYVNYQFVSK
jgi:hypothetical protein